MAKREQPTTFGGPIIDPRVTDPVAMQYAKQMQERLGGPEKYTTQVGGGPSPPIPRLDTPHVDGMTMADQARAASQPPIGSIDPTSSIFPAAPIVGQEGPAKPQMSRPPNNILPQDLLPEIATKDPDFRPGAGSMYASAQPHLAYKYGVIRNKQHLPPGRLGQAGKAGLSSGTLEGLQAIQAAQAGQPVPVPLEQQQKEQAEGRLNDEAKAASLAGAGGVAAQGGGGAEQLSEEDKKKVVHAIDQMDSFDWNTFKQMTMKDLLNNEEQKKIIEERLKATPLSLDELIVNGYVTQRIPIRPGKFEPTFRSIGGDEELACKRLIISDAKKLDVNDQYLLDKHAFMVVCCGLYSINGTVLPTHRNEAGEFDDTKFWEKFNLVIRYPLHMLASLCVHFFWFDIRVRKLFVADALGNG